MMQEALDFREECDALAELLDSASDEDFARITQFKDWTIEDVIGHLHVWNHAAAQTLESRDNWQAFFGFVMTQMGNGASHPEFQCAWLAENADGASGRKLFDLWRGFYPKLAEAYGNADPETRVAWAGPDMSTQSKIIARQMETWAHGQEVFDIMGVERADTDRIRNIAHLGVTTYSWAFRNRGEDPPKPKPYVRLIAPSGAIWEWNDPQDDNAVQGSASEFCQVVTQTRNVQDTAVESTGAVATRWMEIAQCFAGAAETPPAKGVRHLVSS